MEKRRRSVYPTARQKNKLIQLLTKHPKLISAKVSQDFNNSDSQRLWYKIATECNAIPGAKKTWRQWRKTWQDIRSNAKRMRAMHGALPSSVTMLTSAEQETLFGLKNVTSTTNSQEAEFINLDEENALVDTSDNDIGSPASQSEAPEFAEDEDVEVFASQGLYTNTNTSKNQYPDHSKDCLFNCNVMAVQEEKKFQIKKDYYNFKKDYLSQKLVLLKEQNEALKSIAKELAK